MNCRLLEFCPPFTSCFPISFFYGLPPFPFSTFAKYFQYSGRIFRRGWQRTKNRALPFLVKGVLEFFFKKVNRTRRYFNFSCFPPVKVPLSFDVLVARGINRINGPHKKKQQHQLFKVILNHLRPAHPVGRFWAWARVLKIIRNSPFSEIGISGHSGES